MTEQIEAKIEKLLRVADGTANENESAVALEMAQKLADLHNLDLGVIGKSGARKDENISKGLYRYQRTLYAELAELNHCKSWISQGLVKGSKYTIRLLGSKVNVTLTKIMADYVEEVTNRMVRDHFEKGEYFTKNAHYFREGMIDRLIVRIKDRRREQEQERERQRREQEARMHHPGASVENAIVLMSDVAREEERANYDYLYGAGSWDAKEARAMARDRERQEAVAKYEAWQLANPERAAAQAAKAKADNDEWMRQYNLKQERLARAAERRRQKRVDDYGYDPQDYKSSKPTKYDSNAYWKGQDVAETINLDDQIDHQRRKGISA